ncbi:MAG: hypothetical protein HYV47_01455 [Candidatus Nealsonbacteria bacterium]|nr:hypothetical protein [Candidatus Nealsonbacteria bacterium]
MHRVPDWIVAVIGAVYRFVAGGFGATVPHPWPANFCGPFWVAFVGIVPGLPVVLLGWLIRLVFGQGRARRFFGSKPMRVTGKILLVLFYVLVGLTLLGLIVVLAREDWLKTLIWLGAVIAFISLPFAISFAIERVKHTRWYLEKEEEKQRKHEKRLAVSASKQAKPRRSSVIRKILFLPWTVLKVLFRGIKDIIYTIALMVHVFYKKYCPRVEFP